ncbi:hypothetical protein Agub_g10909, partial [Astrephomene gubernaculifera]
MNPASFAPPIRSPRPALSGVGSPSSTCASSRRLIALRYRNAFQPPRSPALPTLPSRLHVAPSPHHEPWNQGRNIHTTAAFHTSRQPASPEAHERQHEEEHSSTQLILLLTLSVVLLTLPWVVDHPATLMVPVALLILPVTSGAVRSLVSEGFALLSGGVQWFWRHRRQPSHGAPPSQPGVSPAPPRRPQPPPHHQPPAHDVYHPGAAASSWQSPTGQSCPGVPQPEPLYVHARQQHHPPPHGSGYHAHLPTAQTASPHPAGLGTQMQARERQSAVRRSQAALRSMQPTQA